MSNTKIQTAAQIAAILGYKKITLGTQRVLSDLRSDEIVIGAWYGTARYTGDIVMRRIEAHYPEMTRIVVAAYGRSQGEDRFAVIAQKPAAPLQLS